MYVGNEEGLGIKKGRKRNKKGKKQAGSKKKETKIHVYNYKGEKLHVHTYTVRTYSVCTYMCMYTLGEAVREKSKKI